MLVQEENEKINSVINKIFNYLNSNLNIKNDLNEYYKAIGISEKNAKLRNTYILNYIFERRLGENRKSIFDFALDDIRDLSTEEREIINMLKNSIDGIFEVRKITHNQFELFNILNEKLYIVHPLAKMNKFSNLSVGHFLMARLIMLNGEYYIYHVIDHITYSNRITAFQIAISRLAQNPALLHHDHPEKLEELKQSSKNMYKKFYELFKAEMIITSNKNADELISALNEFMETETLPDEDLTSYISPIENSEYFDISELQSGGNVLVEAKKGFSSQNQEYNVALVADEKLGLQVIPFMDTFLDIFEKEDFTTIKNYKECVTKFVQEKQISQLPLKIAKEKYPEKFMQRINEIMGTHFATIEDIENKYKKMYIENPYTSSTLVLYSSYAFKRLIDVIDTEKNENMPKQKIGRNDPCPCGSGLKYKRCCGKMVQI